MAQLVRPRSPAEQTVDRFPGVSDRRPNIRGRGPDGRPKVLRGVPECCANTSSRVAHGRPDRTSRVTDRRGDRFEPRADGRCRPSDSAGRQHDHDPGHEPNCRSDPATPRHVGPSGHEARCRAEPLRNSTTRELGQTPDDDRATTNPHDDLTDDSEAPCRGLREHAKRWPDLNSDEAGRRPPDRAQDDHHPAPELPEEATESADRTGHLARDDLEDDDDSRP